MALSAEEKFAIVSIWAKIAPNAEALGAEVLERMLLSFPQTKTCFSTTDLYPGSAEVRSHGKKIINAIGQATRHLDNLDQVLSTLSDLHAYNLRVDPGNFPLLSHFIQVVLAVHFPADFTPTAHAAWDKFLATVLTSKYR